MRFFFSAALLVLAACSGSSGSTVTNTSGTAPAADLTGRWVGRTMTSTGYGGSVTADLVQHGSDIQGSARIPGGCIGGGKVGGFVDADSVSATVTSGDVVATLNLTISDDDQLDGTFDLPPSGVCAAQQGSISLTRK